MTTKEVIFNSSTGEVFVERSDGSASKFNIADTVTAATGAGGGVEKIQPITRAEFAALAVKDPSTLYLITDGV